ncbi:MAG TPA: thiamine pyrophosphate-dependent enzyme, partial [Candidatus Saccharimonadales bacterium]|nr:thiamine pyrophosphate-dependent enzyme [Candidatus Saccharimonadales bacterium]
IDHDKKAQNQRDYLLLQGNAATVTATLSRLVPAAHQVPWFSPTPLKKESPIQSNALNPSTVFARLNDILPKRRIVVVDAGQNTIFAMRMLQVLHNSDFAWTSDFSAIGQGLGVAIGAAFARPKKRITLIVGDGGFMMSIAELDTIARYNLPITIIVINDQGFGQERGALMARSIPAAEANYPSPNLAALAGVYGIKGMQIIDSNDLETLEQTVKDVSGPLLVDIQTDPTIRTDFGARVALHRAKRATQIKSSRALL